jgi:hypothetical protein
MGEWLAGLSLAWGKVIAVIFFVGIAIWAWRRPRSFIFQGAPDSHRWRDLRLWASILMAVQIVIYLSF